MRWRNPLPVAPAAPAAWPEPPGPSPCSAHPTTRSPARRRARRSTTGSTRWSARANISGQLTSALSAQTSLTAPPLFRPETTIGVIPIDSIFSPIRKVAYHVESARVGQRTDYDRLALEVHTDGSVRPEDAVAYAAKILKDQLDIFINFEEEAEPRYEPRTEISKETLNVNLLRPVDRTPGSYGASARTAGTSGIASIATTRITPTA